MKSLKGVVFVFLVFVSSLFGSIFLLFPFIPFAYLSPKLWRSISDRLVGYWLTFPCALCEWVFKVKFRVTGDLIDRNEPAILLMNHRTRLDWLFSWNALYKMDPWLLISEKISLKAPLKQIPGAGWAMSCGSYIFLRRNFNDDIPVMEKIVRYFKNSENNYQILLFAEGTDKSERATKLSNEFAEKNGLEKYEYVLHPRTTGFEFLFDLMKKENYIKHVYDLTIAYEGEIVETEMKLVKEGAFPEKVHLDVKKYDVEEISKENCKKWLQNLWKEKEQKLKNFYENDKQFEPSGNRYLWPEETRGIGYIIAFSFWCLISFFWAYTIYLSFWVKIYTAIAMIFYCSTLKFHNGLEYLVMKWFEMKNKKKAIKEK